MARIRTIVNGDGEVELESFMRFQIGQNPVDGLIQLQVIESPIFPLLSYEATILYPDDELETFGLDDLYRTSMSSARRLNTQELLVPPIELSKLAGAVCELKSSQQFTLPELGLVFRPSDLGDLINNVEWILEYPDTLSPRVKIVHDSQEPEVSMENGIKILSLHWDHLVFEDTQPHPMEQRGAIPTVYAAIVPFQSHISEVQDSASNSWVDWGNWYLDILDSRLELTAQVKELSEQIIQGASDDLEKMRRIYDFCRENIRYEQDYLAFGEFIPNPATLTLENRYGDCKDYSLLMHQLAASAGIKTQLALCYRGRGQQFHPDVPVSQFNHMILYFVYAGQDYWLDGTNRIGTFGIPTSDLLNQTALILTQDGSYLKGITTHTPGDLHIVCDLKPATRRNLAGEIALVFRGSQAIVPSYWDWYLSKEAMDAYLRSLAHHLISPDMIIDELRWKRTPEGFTYIIDVTLPNTLFGYSTSSFLNPGNIFKSLNDMLLKEIEAEQLYYYPDVADVTLAITINGLHAVGKDPTAPFTWRMGYRLDPGPYLTRERQDQVIDEMTRVKSEMVTQYQLGGN